MTQVYGVTSTNLDRKMTQCLSQYLSFYSLSMAISMHSIKFLFVVWAFLVLGGITRCKPPNPTEPFYSPRTLTFGNEGSNRTEETNVDALGSINCADYRSTCADYRSGRGVSSLSRTTSSPHASSPLDRLFDFLARSTRETTRLCSLALGTPWDMAAARANSSFP
jgi:hypothetical protein